MSDVPQQDVDNDLLKAHRGVMVDANAFTRADPSAERARRAYAALTHLAARHANTPELRARQVHPDLPSPDELVRLAAVMAGGTAAAEPGEPDLDASDLVAALTLMPCVRADLDSIEIALLKAAREHGMTWQEIAFSLGLGTPQAAKQRFDRLEARTEDEVNTPPL